VPYDTHGWRNRNRIKTAQGPRWLTVPVRHHGLGRPRILEVEIDNGTPWARKHVESLRQAYARAPHASDGLPALQAVLERPWQRLVDLDIAVAEVLASALAISTRVVRSSSLGVNGERSERLVRICQQFGATTYVSGAAARSYLDVPLFERHSIEVEWQQFVHPAYPQQHGEFVSHLSAVDLLLNCGPDSPAVLGAPAPLPIDVEQPTSRGGPSGPPVVKLEQAGRGGPSGPGRGGPSGPPFGKRKQVL
jgi:hypothetical protein